MQIEVDDEKKVSIRTDIERRGKESQRGPSETRVVFRRVLPHRSEWPTVCDRDVIKLSIGRNNNAVWTIDIYRHVAGVDLLLDARARWSKTYERDLVRTF